MKEKVVNRSWRDPVAEAPQPADSPAEAGADIDVRAATDLFLVLGDGEKLLWAGRPHAVLYGLYYVVLAIEPARRLFFSHDRHASLEGTAALFGIVAFGLVLGLVAKISYGITDRRAISLLRIGWFDPSVSYVTVTDLAGGTASFNPGLFGTVTIRGAVTDPSRFGFTATELQATEPELSDGVLPLPGHASGSVSFIGLGDCAGAWKSFKAAREQALMRPLPTIDPLDPLEQLG